MKPFLSRHGSKADFPETILLLRAAPNFDQDRSGFRITDFNCPAAEHDKICDQSDFTRFIWVRTTSYCLAMSAFLFANIWIVYWVYVCRVLLNILNMSRLQRETIGIGMTRDFGLP